jgi:D-inositol-3-phosphate glycosyltransferase
MVSEHASPLALLGGVDAGGQNVFVAELSRTLGARGVDDPLQPEWVPFGRNVVVHHVAAGPPAPMPKDELHPYMGEFARRLEEAWVDGLPDVVHSHFWMSGQAAYAATRAVGVPLMHTFHALGVVKRRHQGERDSSPPQRAAVERMLAIQAERVIATSYDEVRELRGMGADGSNVSVIPCGVDRRRYRPDGPVEHRPTDRPRVVVLSRLVERKGIGNVIAALRALPEVELVIAGGPPAGLVADDAEARRFLALAASLGVADRVELRGSVDRDGVPALLRSADVVACCPWYEPFGMVAVEAMACGVPVVATRVGGLAETVVDGRTGLLVPPRNPEAIAGAIGRLLREPGLRARMGRAAVERSRRYGWPLVAGRLLEETNRLVRHTPASPVDAS